MERQCRLRRARHPHASQCRTAKISQTQPQAGAHLKDGAQRRLERGFQHPVGLVQNERRRARKRRREVLRVREHVREAAGRGHDDVRPPAQRNTLRVLVHAADNDAVADARAAAQRLELLLDLEGELPARARALLCACWPQATAVQRLYPQAALLFALACERAVARALVRLIANVARIPTIKRSMS